MSVVSRAIDSLLRRVADLLAKLRGQEPYLSWRWIIWDWGRGFGAIIHPERLRGEELAGTADEIVSVEPEGDLSRVSTRQGFTVYWPARMGTGLLEQVLEELTPGHAHNYFDLYEPGPEDIVFDVGACEGMFALRLVGKVAHVHVFEPVHEVAVALEKTLESALAAGTASVHEFGFSDVTGVETLMVNPDRPELSTTDRELQGYDSQDGFEACQLKFETIDEFVEREAIDRLDCVKMDIEGSELAALQGASRTLERLAPDVVLAVYHQSEDIHTIPAFLESLGYTVYAGETTYYPHVRLVPRHQLSRPHYRPHLMLASRRSPEALATLPALAQRLEGGTR